ncbi:MAG TPA: hypothetical protein VFS83_07935, partial [Ktedonobacterales bacterium]|nr:hypothetical protein [Ktedonobacterales bacterium]
MSRQDSQPPTGYSEDDDNARGQRIAAMRELTEADTSPASPPISPAMKHPVRRIRRVPIALIALTAVVLLAVVGAAWQGWLPWQRSGPAATDSTISVNLADNNLHCPGAAVWSPDNKRIAVLAQLGACANGSFGIIEPNVVALFDTQGNLERMLYPDTTVLGAKAPTTAQPTPTVGTDSSAIAPAYVEYFAMSWSPDGKRLALTYEATLPYGQETNTFESGLVFLPAGGADGEKISGFNQTPYDIWDLQTRKQIHGDNTAQVFALAYQWSAQGTLTPVEDATTLGPVGNPAAGQRFTIWQPGSVYLDREKQALDFSASYMVWSPDGRYLAPNFGFGGELTQSASGIVRLDDGAYQLPYRDKALVFAASQLKSPSNPDASVMPVSWRSDGRLLA